MFHSELVGAHLTSLRPCKKPKRFPARSPKQKHSSIYDPTTYWSFLSDINYDYEFDSNCASRSKPPRPFRCDSIEYQAPTPRPNPSQKITRTLKHNLISQSCVQSNLSWQPFQFCHTRTTSAIGLPITSGETKPTPSAPRKTNKRQENNRKKCLTILIHDRWPALAKYTSPATTTTITVHHRLRTPL